MRSSKLTKLMLTLLVAQLILSIAINFDFLKFKMEKGQILFVQKICQNLNSLEYAQKEIVILEQDYSRWMIPIRAKCGYGNIVTLKESALEIDKIGRLLNANANKYSTDSFILVSNRQFSGSNDITVNTKELISKVGPPPFAEHASKFQAWVGKVKIKNGIKFSNAFPLLKMNILYDLSEPNVDQSFLGEGWSARENWGVWTEGNKSVINFKLSKKPKNMVHIELLGHPFLYGSQNQLTTTVYFNSEFMEVKLLDNLSKKIQVDVDVSRIKNNNSLELLFTNLKSPSELGLNGDRRKIGYALQGMLVSGD